MRLLVTTFRCRLAAAAALLWLAGAAAGCDPVARIGGARNRHLASSKPVEVGVVWDTRHGSFFRRGVDLAIKDVNARGGALGRHFRAVHLAEDITGLESRERAEQGREAARRLASRPATVAVIGHRDSSAAVAASVTYNRFGVLYIAPGATTPLLTHLGFRYLFRTIEDSRFIADTLAMLCRTRQFKTVAILAERTDYGLDLASEFYEALHDGSGEVQVVFQTSLAPAAENYFAALAELQRLEPDAVMLAVDLPVGVQLLNEAQQFGYEAQFLSGEGMFSSFLLPAAQTAAEGLIVATSVGHAAHNPEFIKRFSERYGVPPNGWAQQGYDSVMLLASGIERAQSFEFADIAAAIRNNSQWHSAFGAFAFNEAGQVQHRPIYLEQVKDGKFEVIAKYINGRDGEPHPAAEPRTGFSWEGERKNETSSGAM